MRYIIVALIAVLFINAHALTLVGAPRLFVHEQVRYEFTEAIKPGLTVVLYFNQAIEHGDEPADLVVYGYWLESYRYYADFEWIGAIYGYANHFEFAEAARDGGAYGLWLWLRKYEVDYLVWNENWMHRSVPHFGEFEMPVDDSLWGDYFERMPDHGAIRVWKVKS